MTSCAPRSPRTATAAEPRVVGLVLTGGFRPAGDLLAELRAARVFAYLVGTDTYRTAQAVDEILVKTHASDTEKIATIIDLVDGRSTWMRYSRACEARRARREAERGHPSASRAPATRVGRGAGAAVTSPIIGWRPWPALVLSWSPRRRPRRAERCP